MTSADLLRRVRLIELRALRKVEDLLAGPYRSVFRGRGLEFDDIREYQPGDDVRSIDWHATARTGVVQTKQLVEERCLTVILAVDVSASGEFGSGPQSKRELAAELGAVIALSAVLSHDRVGLLLFTDRVERYLPPAGGRRQAFAIVAAILGHTPRSPRTSVHRALLTLSQALRRHATLFLISDFLDEGFERTLRITARRHDVIALEVRDGAEAALPELGWVAWEDAETGEVVELNTAHAEVRHAFGVHQLERAARLQNTFRLAGVDRVACQTGVPFYPALVRLFENRRPR
jgi:uncharacterized protein (DUF58 family)